LTYAEFFEKLSAEQQEVVRYLDAQLINECQLNRKIRYKVPFYDYGTWLCYINPKKQNMIELCFMKGHELAKKHEILEKNGRKMVAGLTIDPQADIPISEILTLIKSAKSLAK